MIARDQLELALRLVARGIPVFPCKLDKRPLTQNGFKDAVCDTLSVNSWWQAHPDALVGVPTGRISNLLAVDLDVIKQADIDAGKLLPGEHLGYKVGEENFKRLGFGSLIDIEASRLTPSGGRHVFFALPAQESFRSRNGVLARKIDIKADGGYVVAYSDLPEPAVMPADLLAALKKLDVGKAAAPSTVVSHISIPPKNATLKAISSAARRKDAYVEAALYCEVAALATTPSGSRNEQLNRSAFSLGSMVGAGLLERSRVENALTSAALTAGLDAFEIARTLRSGLEAGMRKPRDIPDRSHVSPGRSSTPEVVDAREGKVTEDALALAFVDRHGHNLRFCHGTGAWFEWDGLRWKQDRTERAFERAREVCRDMNQKGEVRLAKAVTTMAVERLARTDQRVAVTNDVWDRDHWLLGTPEGTVDLHSGALIPAHRDHYLTKLTTVAPANQGAHHPQWSRFLNEATGGDVALQRFLQQVAGYCLTGDTREHALFFIYGPGGNGKSVFVNMLAAMLGEHARPAPMETFTASAGTRHPTELAMLRGVRLVTVSETEQGKSWAEARIKQLTGGDVVGARFMRQDFFDFLPIFKLLFVGNHKPTLNNIDEATRRRFNIIPFLHQPQTIDLELEAKLRLELPAILRWAIDGCLDWQANGLMRPSVVVEATQGYFDDQDTLSQWLSEACQCSPSVSDTTQNLYTSFSAFMKAAGDEAPSMRVFKPMLERAGFRPTKHTPGQHARRGFLGIRAAKLSSGGMGLSR